MRNGDVVFRAAHESAKQMKAFMADRSGRKN